MRVVSLLPAATEWVFAFGAGDRLVGRSHACDYPPSARALPAVTRPAFAAEADAAALDAAVRNRLRQGGRLWDLDLEQLRALRPDLLLTLAQDDAEGAAWTGTPPQLFAMAPTTLKEVLDAALRLGRLLGRMEAAMRFLAGAEHRLRALRERLGLHRRSDPSAWPTVACLAWMDPLMTAGCWIPDVVEMAGGRAVLAEKGAPSRLVAWETLRAADPDVIALAPCGRTLEQARRDLPLLTQRDGWAALKAVRTGRLFLFDGNAHFNRPGPRLYRAVELLAAALHPDRLDRRDEAVADEEMQRLEA